jgi:hypothetical protein
MLARNIDAPLVCIDAKVAVRRVQLVMKDGKVIDRIVRGEKLADSPVMGVNQIAAQAINISSSPAPAGDRITSSTSGYDAVDGFSTGT